MPRGYEILFDLGIMHDYAHALVRKVASGSIECPEVIERNRDFIRQRLAEIQDQLAIVDEKTSPKEVRDAA